eukprot:RCo022417
MGSLHVFRSEELQRRLVGRDQPRKGFLQVRKGLHPLLPLRYHPVQLCLCVREISLGRGDSLLQALVPVIVRAVGLFFFSEALLLLFQELLSVLEDAREFSKVGLRSLQLISEVGRLLLPKAVLLLRQLQLGLGAVQLQLGLIPGVHHLLLQAGEGGQLVTLLLDLLDGVLVSSGGFVKLLAQAGDLIVQCLHHRVGLHIHRKLEEAGHLAQLFRLGRGLLHPPLRLPAGALRGLLHILNGIANLFRLVSNCQHPLDLLLNVRPAGHELVELRLQAFQLGTAVGELLLFLLQRRVGGLHGCSLRLALLLHRQVLLVRISVALLGCRNPGGQRGNLLCLAVFPRAGHLPLVFKSPHSFLHP